MKRLAVTFAWLAALAGCLEAPPTGSRDGGGSGTDGGGGGAPCGTTAALHDDFDGAGLDLSLWGGTGGVSVSNGEVQLVSGPGYYNTLQSAARYRVSGGSLAAEMDVSQLANALVSMELETPDGNLVGIRLLNGELGLRVINADGDRVVDTAPLEQDHIWLRLREEAGAFFWATSSDGTGWAERGPFEASIGEIARLDFELLPNSEAATWIVQTVNPDTSVPYCAAASFTDDFSSQSPLWSVDEQGDCQITLAGQAELEYSAQALCALTTRERFDLQGSSFAVELMDAGDCKPEPIMVISLAGGQDVSIKCRDDGGAPELVAGHKDAPDISEAPYQPAVQRFLRVRHNKADGNLVFETHDGGPGSWDRLGSLPVTSGAVSRTSLRFYLGGDTTGGESESVTFDNFNLAPP